MIAAVRARIDDFAEQNWKQIAFCPERVAKLSPLSGVAKIIAGDHAVFMATGLLAPGVKPFKDFRVITAGFHSPIGLHIKRSYFWRTSFDAALFVTVTENNGIKSHANSFFRINCGHRAAAARLRRTRLRS